MIKPFKGTFPLTQSFGVNPQSYAQFNLKGHNGLDYATPVGTLLIAPIHGTVIEVAYDAPGYGWYLKIENENEGVVLAHFSQIFVNVGQAVAMGNELGLSGNTGNVYPRPTVQNPNAGAHVHFGWYRKPRNRSNGFGGFEDQLSLLSGSGTMEASKMNTYPFLPFKTQVAITADSLRIRTTPVTEDTNIENAYKRDQIVSVEGLVVGDTPENSINPLWWKLDGLDRYIWSGFTEQRVFHPTDSNEDMIADLRNQLHQLHLVVSGFQSLGYATGVELQDALNKKSEVCRGQKEQLDSVLQRNMELAEENAKLHEMLASKNDQLKQKDAEDDTAIQHGIEIEKQHNELIQNTEELKKAAGVKSNNFMDLINKVLLYKSRSDKAAKQAQKQAEQQAPVPQVTTSEPTERFDFNWLLSLFGLLAKKGGDTSGR